MYVHEEQDFHQRTFAGPNALNPCMIKVCVAGISTLVEPSTAASAATEFAGFLNSAAVGTTLPAYRGCTRCRRCFCGHAGVTMKQDK